MSSSDSILDVYIYESSQLLDELENLMIQCDKNESFSPEDIGDIFRILHTVKGSSAMMNFDSIASLSHALEDLFDYLRGHEARSKDYRHISDLVFSSLDMLRSELGKVQENGTPDADVSGIIAQIREFHDLLTHRKTAPADEEPALSSALGQLKPPAEGESCFKAHVFFQKGSKMENIRALGIVKSLQDLCSGLSTVPADLFGEQSEDEIIADGFVVYMVSGAPRDMLVKKIREAFFIERFEFDSLTPGAVDALLKAQTQEAQTAATQPDAAAEAKAHDSAQNTRQSYMSVNLGKLDQLMDIVGEIVITESTVTQNPEVLGLNLESFEKASRQLRKLTDELQNIVMSIRMVPVSATFHKMERIVRDMSVKFDKKAHLVIVGEDTELDKNVLDTLSDPLMHIIRNSMDHGLEPADERERLGKNPVGEIMLSARNLGSDVQITIRDDGRGLNKEKLLDKGIAKGLIKKPREEVTDKEAYGLIFTPGFSTKEQVTEFSGRGVGMDVVMRNIEKIGGTLSVDSQPGKGMSIHIRIPLTLAIIAGMQVSAGESSFIVPLLSIRESFKPGKKDVFKSPEGSEMIWLRGNCYTVLRLHKLFGLETDVTRFEDGILMLLEAQGQMYCLFVDALVGEQQTVVKPIPAYIARDFPRVTQTLAGCTILGDGRISLILDINGLLG